MSNSRLSLTEFVSRAVTQSSLLPVGTGIADAYASNYLTDFGKKWPFVWVLAQKSRAFSDTDGFSNYSVQHFTQEIVVRAVVQRYAPGKVNVGADINTMVDAVIEIYRGWQPTGADMPLYVVATQDGPPWESIVFADVIFGTQVTYAGAAP